MRVQRHFHEAKVIKTCECGARYALGAWKDLALRGLQETSDGDLFLELRDCSCCQSTISLVVHVPPAFDPAATLAANGPFEPFGLSP